MSSRTRPDTHSFVIVGLDPKAGTLKVHLPIAGWYGIEKYRTVNISFIRKRMEPLRPELKYKTIVYLPTGKPSKGEEEITALVRERIRGKLRGEAAAYGLEKNPRYLYGPAAMRALRTDLEPLQFQRCLENPNRRQGLTPLELLVQMKLGFYQMQFITALAAEYLEEQRRTTEWEWLGELHRFYYRLYLTAGKLVEITRTHSDQKFWEKAVQPVLLEMRTTLESTARHLEKFPRAVPDPGREGAPQSPE